MSKYLVDKFLFTVDRDHDLTERYREDPVSFVGWWEDNLARRILGAAPAEDSTWGSFTEAERAALVEQDHVALFELGAHPFLTLTLWIAMFERDWDEPLGMQLDYAAKLGHLTLPYPDIAT